MEIIDATAYKMPAAGTIRPHSWVALLSFAFRAVLICLTFTASPSLAEAATECVSEVQEKYQASPAFKIACQAPGDCEFEPSQPMNASAMAVIDAMAKTVIECWQKGGLTVAVPIPSPPSFNLSVQQYKSPGENTPAAVCSIAQLKPFGQDKLTTLFRAACDRP